MPNGGGCIDFRIDSTDLVLRASKEFRDLKGFPFPARDVRRDLDPYGLSAAS